MTSALFHDAEARSAVERAYERLLEDTPQARAHSVTTRFGETQMLVAGPEDAPPLVVLHGAMANSALAMREGHSFFDKFRVYALDVLGQSVKGADVRLRAASDDYADWLVDVLDALELPKAHVYGASMGGYIARKLAERAPERIDRLVLLVPAGIIAGPILRGMAKAAIPMLLYRTMGSRAGLARFLDSMLTVPDAPLAEYLGAALKHYKLEVTAPPLATPEALASFDRPTLVIGASDDITAPGQALLARAAKLFPHARLELLPDTKHIPATDAASREALGGMISSFLLA
jgi:2-hydroxy-6-oxonona-2,4-dienedioate hydrolase